MTPTTIIVDAVGAEIDWFVGYDPPPDDFLAKLEKASKGIDTVKSFSERCARNPEDAEAAFKLALKYDERYLEDKALEKLKAGLALDPDGKSGRFITDFEKAKVTYSEYAEFKIGVAALLGSNQAGPNFEPLKAFIKKYPDSQLLKTAYNRLSNFMTRAPKDEAARFFDEFASKFPNDAEALYRCLTYYVRMKDTSEKAVEIAEKLKAVSRLIFQRLYDQTLADFYLLKGDKLMAEQSYGPDHIKGKQYRFALELLYYANFWARKNENLESALEIADVAVKTYPGSNTILSQAADVFMRLKKEDKALDLFGPAYAKKNWDDSDNLWSYANFWAMQGKNLDDALAAANRIIELKPNNSSGYDALSSVLQKLKNFPEAIKAAQKAYDLEVGSMKEYMKSKLDRVKAAAEKEKK